jgi:hypothetical protein
MYVNNMLICSNKIIGECNRPLLLECMYSFGCALSFVMQILFFVNMVNTKVVVNFMI